MALFVYFTHISCSFRYAYRERIIYRRTRYIEYQRAEIQSDRQFVVVFVGIHISSFFSASKYYKCFFRSFVRSPQTVRADFNNICMPLVVVVVLFNLFSFFWLNRSKPVGCVFFFCSVILLS